MNKQCKTKQFAKKLLAMSQVDGLLNHRKISAILKALPRNNETLRVLKEYYSLIECEKIKQTITIVSTQNIDESSIAKLTKHFETTLGRKFSPIVVIDNSIIAGIRVHAGDKIFEKSIHSTLATLQDLR